MNKNIEKNILQKINLYLHPDRFISLEKAVDKNKKELPLGGVLNYIFCYRPWGRDDQLIGDDKEIDYLIKNSDLKAAPPEGWTAIMHAFNNNKRKQLNLNRKQLNYLIKNSDLKFKSYNGTTALHLALMKNATEELMLTEKMMRYLVFNSDLNVQSRNNQSILSLALNMSTEKNYLWIKKSGSI